MGHQRDQPQRENQELLKQSKLLNPRLLKLKEPLKLSRSLPLLLPPLHQPKPQLNLKKLPESQRPLERKSQLPKSLPLKDQLLKKLTRELPRRNDFISLM